MELQDTLMHGIKELSENSYTMIMLVFRIDQIYQFQESIEIILLRCSRGQTGLRLVSFISEEHSALSQYALEYRSVCNRFDYRPVYNSSISHFERLSKKAMKAVRNGDI